MSRLQFWGGGGIRTQIQFNVKFQYFWESGGGRIQAQRLSSSCEKFHLGGGEKSGLKLTPPNNVSTAESHKVLQQRYV